RPAPNPCGWSSRHSSPPAGGRGPIPCPPKPGSMRSRSSRRRRARPALDARSRSPRSVRARVGEPRPERWGADRGGRLPSEILTPATLGEPELGRYRVRHPSFASGRLAATLVLALLALTLSGAHSPAQVATLPVTAGIAVVTSFSGIDPSTSNPPDLTIAAGLRRLLLGRTHAVGAPV